MTRVVIVDSNLSNIDSVARAVTHCDGNAVIAHDASIMDGASHIILPGVGAFPDAMQELRARNFDSAIKAAANRGTHILGICLGMQLLATRSYEHGDTDGLDLIPGEVKPLQPAEDNERIPHAGWNEVYWLPDCALSREIEDGKDFYFVHSYHFVTANDSDIAGTTPYCGGFTSSVQRANVYGVQFHPEKSQKTGMQVLKNFLAI